MREGGREGMRQGGNEGRRERGSERGRRKRSEGRNVQHEGWQCFKLEEKTPSLGRTWSDMERHTSVQYIRTSIISV